MAKTVMQKAKHENAEIFFLNLTKDIFVMLWDELLPLIGCWLGEVHIDETVAWSVQVRFEGKHSVLVRHVLVLGVKVVDQLHPRQQPCCDTDCDESRSKIKS